MSYTINNTRGSVVTTVTPGTTQVVGGITLIGKNYTGYGEIIAEDFVRILENQASNTAPSAALTGQLWYDTTTNQVGLKVYNGTGWDRTTPQVGSTTPSSPTAGTLWLDTGSDNVLKIYNGSDWISTAMGSDDTKQVPVTVKVGDNSWVSTSVRKNGYSSNSDAEVGVTAVIGKDASGVDTVIAVYSPASFTISSNTTSYANTTTVVGKICANFTADGANVAGSLNAGLNIRDGFIDAESAPLADESLALQDSGNSSISYSSDDLFVLAKTTDQTHSGNLVPSSNNAIDLGSSSNKYANIYGVSVEATYADIAERFEADEPLDAGTVIALGGAKEITKTAERADNKVFGVISKTPAFKMNAGAGDDATHPFVAFSGRVLCKVKGPVTKGDRLVSSDVPGVAVKANPDDDWKATFGRALVDKTSDEIEKITIAIGVK